MNKLVWGLGIAGFALWSLLTWGTYALVVLAGDWFAASAGLLAAWPEWQYWAQWSLRLVEGFGIVLLWIVWGLGALFILGGTWLLAHLAGKAQRIGSAPTRPI